VLVLEGIRVYNDGDKGANRGELRFDAAVNQVDEPSVRIKERKVASGSWLSFGHDGRLTYLPQSRAQHRRTGQGARQRQHQLVLRDDRGRCGLSRARSRRRTWVTVRGVVDLDATGPYGHRDFTLMTSNAAGIRFVVDGHVDVRYD
jgi:hypothetical protein